MTSAVCGYEIYSIPSNISYGLKFSSNQWPVIPIYPALLLAVHKSVVIEIDSEELTNNDNRFLIPILYASVINSLIVLSQGIEKDGSSLEQNFLKPSLFRI